MSLLDPDGQPARAINWHRNLIKSTEALLGICRGLIADNHLSEQEIVFLDTWLRDNQEITKSWPGDVIARRVQAILADGVVTSEEAEDLKETLSRVTGTELEYGIVGGMSTSFPVEPVHSIIFDGKTFCFTGKFIYGSRAKCELATTALGAFCTANVSRQVDYVVIGALASRDWVNTSFGRKIERAVQLKQSGHQIAIISEENWTQFV